MEDNTPRFDPETGKPITPAPENSEAKKADPEPQAEQPAAEAKTETKAQKEQSAAVDSAASSDSENGKSAEGEKTEEAKAEQQAEQQPTVQGSKKVSRMILCGIIGVVAVIVIIIAVAAMNSPKTRVARAIRNTLEDSLDAFGDFSVLTDGGDEASVTISGDYGEITAAHKKNDRYLALNMDLSSLGYYYNADEVDYQFELTDSLFLMDNGSDAYYFDFTKDNSDGYIAEYLDNVNVDIEDVQKILQELADDENYEAFAKKVAEDIELKREDSEAFEIDGKDVKCAGYSMRINQAFVNTVLDDAVDTFDLADALVSIDPDWEDELDSAIEEAMGTSSWKVTFYLHGSQLAAVTLRNSDTDEETTVIFEGGDFPADNLEVQEDGETTLTVEDAEDDQGAEIAKVIKDADGIEIGAYYYDEGKLSIYEYGDLYGTFELTTDEHGIEIDYTDAASDANNFSYDLTDSADFESLSAKDAEDLGEYTESDFEDMMESFSNLSDFYSLFYYMY